MSANVRKHWARHCKRLNHIEFVPTNSFRVSIAFYKSSIPSQSFMSSSEVCSVLLPCWRLSRVIWEIPARSSISISFLKHQHQLTTFPKQSAGPGRVFVHRRHFLSRKFSLTEDDLATGKSLASYKPQQGSLQNWQLQLNFYIKLLWLIKPVKLWNLVKL